MKSRKAQKAAEVAFAQKNAKHAFEEWFKKEQEFKKGGSACAEKRAWKKYQKAQVAVYDARFA